MSVHAPHLTQPSIYTRSARDLSEQFTKFFDGFCLPVINQFTRKTERFLVIQGQPCNGDESFHHTFA